MRFPTTILILCLSFSPTAFAVIALQNYQAERHHRFDNNTAFVGSGYDWSGVARSSNGRWVTMISSTHFVTAFHAQPSGSVTFHEDNDPSGATVTSTIASLTRVGMTDISIGRLSTAPGPTIAIYGISSNTTDGASFPTSPYADREAFTVGLNDTGSGTTQFRVGRNVLDGFYDVATVGSTTADAITFDDDRDTAESLGDDEAFLQSGDSGAPMFITSGGELALVGTNWFITSEESPNFSGTSFLPNHISEIETILQMGGESLTLISVPEPTALLMLCLGAFTYLGNRRR